MICAPSSPLPGIASRLFDSWLDSCRLAADVSTRYWTDALRRGATPLDGFVDGANWARLVTTRRKPTWSSPNEVVTRSAITALRDFSPAGATGAPALILPPQAGHHSCIVDYSPGQSQVRTAIEAGLERLYVLEWLGATRETRDVSIDDYVAELRAAIARIGEPVHLIGDCQGGWLATIYAALHPGDVRTLTIGGAPIDFHAGDPLISHYARIVAHGGMDTYRAMVAAGGGLLRGEMMVGGFIALQPEAELEKHFELLMHLHDDEFVTRYAEFEDWFKYTQDIAGAFFLWIVEHLFVDNGLIAGDVVVEGRTVRLADISCPLTLIGGSTDHITPPSQVFALERYVSTPALNVTKLLVPGGHLGLFMGRSSLQNAWLPLLRALAA